MARTKTIKENPGARGSFAHPAEVRANPRFGFFYLRSK